MINKNEEEIEKILKDLEKVSGEWLEDLEDEIKTKLQERIKTSILWCEDEIEFIENHVYYDNEPCRFDHHGYCQDHHTCGDDKCSNEIILNRLQQLQSHLNWLKEQEKKQ